MTSFGRMSSRGYTQWQNLHNYILSMAAVKQLFSGLFHFKISLAIPAAEIFTGIEF